MNLWGRLLRAFGWTVDITLPAIPKCVICVAPHTSNLDFPIGLAAYRSIGRKANFLMKEFWFFWPLSILLKSLGGIPVKRGKGRGGLTKAVAGRFAASVWMNLAVTPEGTRSRNAEWHTGFLRIAVDAGVPVLLGVIDYSAKRVEINSMIFPTGDIEADMATVKAFYKDRQEAARRPDQFAL